MAIPVRPYILSLLLIAGLALSGAVHASDPNTSQGDEADVMSKVAAHRDGVAARQGVVADADDDASDAANGRDARRDAASDDEPQQQAAGEAGAQREAAHQRVAQSSIWLGCKLSPLNLALAKALKLEVKEQQSPPGVMVRNVVEGGPADKAGLIRYDVITKVGKEHTVNSLGDFARAVQGRKPGDTLDLTLKRQGESIEKRLTCAAPQSAEDQQKTKWKYPLMPEQVQGNRRTVNGIWYRDRESGDWQYQRAAGPNDASIYGSLPEGVRKQIKSQVHVGPDGKAAYIISAVKNGITIEVERGADGSLTVRRKKQSPDGDPLVYEKPFSDENELKTKDPDAYAIYASRIIKTSVTWPEAEEDAPKRDDLRDLLRLKQHIRQLLKSRRADPSMATLLENALKQIDVQIKARRSGKSIEQLSRELEALKQKLRETDARNAVEYEWQVHDDGRFTVVVKKGTDTLKLSFESEEAFRKAHPKLHERYEKRVKTLLPE